MTIFINIIFKGVLLEAQCMLLQFDSGLSKVPRRAILNYFQCYNSKACHFFQISMVTFLLLILLDLHFIYSFGFHYCTGEKMNLFGLICLPHIFGFMVIADGYKNTCMYTLCLSSWQVNSFTAFP